MTPKAVFKVGSLGLSGEPTGLGDKASTSVAAGATVHDWDEAFPKTRHTA